jgi:hypothetical protein
MHRCRPDRVAADFDAPQYAATVRGFAALWVADKMRA